MAFENKIATSTTFISIVALLSVGIMVIWFGVNVSIKVILTIFLLIFCGMNTLIAYGSFSEALAHTEASRVSAIMALTPIITSTIVQLFPMEGVQTEPLYVLTLVGAIMVVVGSIVVAIARKGTSDDSSFKQD